MKQSSKAGFSFAAASAVLAFLTLPIAVSATPPSAVTLVYSEKTHTLGVAISHTSHFLKSHYIAFVDIKKNGKTVESATYTSQPEKKDFTYIYRIDASEGDVIEATVTCNFFGSKSATLAILPAAAKTR